MQTKTHIRFHGDIADPYSYLGRALFDKVHAEFGGEIFQIETAPFEINPDLPINGIAFDQFLLARFGEQAEVAKTLLPLTQAHEEGDLELALDIIKITPNTRNAHRVMLWAREFGADYELLVRLQDAYFVRGLDIGNNAVLRAQADAIALEGAVFANWLDTDRDDDTITNEIVEHAKAGITQVPLWVIGGSYAVPGVQSIETWREIIGEIDAKGREAALIKTN